MERAQQPLTGQLREQALALFKAGIAAADPYLAVKRYLQFESNQLSITGVNGSIRTGGWQKIHVLAFGKAACPMLTAALEIIPAALISQSLAVTNYENLKPLSGAEVIGAGHPLPDESGLQAAKKCAAIADNAQAGELVLVLVSGGGSALLPYPVDTVSLADKTQTTQLLLASGATINEINAVRKHLSILKGGGLARLIAPADCHALILSDVIGDDLSAIASGTTVPDKTTFTDAVNILQNYHIWQKVPEAVCRYLQSGLQGFAPETPKPDDNCFAHAIHTLIGSNRISLDAVMQAAQQQGKAVMLYNDNLCGEAKGAAGDFVAFALKQAQTFKGKPLAIVAGGETTVTLIGKGKGGRNQEMALAFAIEAETHNLTGNWVFLSGGTDGRDGPTDAAGGLVDPLSLQRIRAAGGKPYDLLSENSSYSALTLSNDLLITGGTGTNVADLQILLIQN